MAPEQIGKSMQKKGKFRNIPKYLWEFNIRQKWNFI